MKHNYLRASIWQLLVFLCATTLSLAQTVVTGKVSSREDNSSLPGVTVSVKGTTRGTTTDANGAYSVAVDNSNAVLVFSFIGYTTEEVAVGNRTTINVQLDSDIKSLSEVVVTGYSTQEKKDITGAVATVKVKDLVAVPAFSFTNQLQGRVAGLNVAESGEPGSGASIRIRGITTFGNNEPLYVIDGVPRTGRFQNAINPNDIETIQVLKDGSAASIYGARAAAGVIIITTKKGKAGETKISYDAYYGQQSPARYIDVLTSSQDWANQRFTALRNAGIAIADAGQNIPALYGTGERPVMPDYILPVGAKEGDPRVDPSKYNADINSSNFNLITRANKQGTDWQREIFGTAPIQSHNINVLGGTEKGRYGVSFNYFDQQGILKTTYSKRYSVRANSEFKVKKYVTVGENLTVSAEDKVTSVGDSPSEGTPIMGALRAQPIMPVYDINGFFAGARGIVTNASNPVAQLERNKNNKQRYITVFGNIYSNVNFGFLDDLFGSNFLKDLDYRTSIGGNYYDGFTYGFTYRNIEAAEPNSSNGFGESASYGLEWTWTNTLTYTKVIGDIHNIKAYVGTEAILNRFRNLGANRINYFTDDPTFWTLNAGDPKGATNSSSFGQSSLYSLFARADYSLYDKYLLSATVRRDGSSRFGPNNRFAVFPAISAGWRLSKEAFMQNIPWINDLKVRVSWGQTGNQDIDAANAYSTFGSGASFSGYAISGSNNNSILGFALNRIGNANTKWETTTSTNLGLDASLLQGKIDVTVDLWNRRTSDLLFVQSLPGTASDAAPPAINIGDMQNKGIDVTINHRNTTSSGFRYDVGLVYGMYRNEILRVGETDNTFFTGGGTRLAGGFMTKSIKGLPMSMFYGYQIDGIFASADEIKNAADHTAVGIKKTDANLDPYIGRWRFKDLNGDKVINDQDFGPIGNPHPKFTYGLNLSFGYKNFDLTAFFQGVYGNDLYAYYKYFTDFETFNGNRRQESVENSWTPQNTDTKVPRLNFNDGTSNLFSTSYYIEKGSYFRARSIQLGYTIPKVILSKVGLDNLRVYVQGANLFTITKYKGYDPAFAQNNGSDNTIGVDYAVYPLSRQIIFGINLAL